MENIHKTDMEVFFKRVKCPLKMKGNGKIKIKVEAYQENMTSRKMRKT